MRTFEGGVGGVVCVCGGGGGGRLVFGVCWISFIVPIYLHLTSMLQHVLRLLSHQQYCVHADTCQGKFIVPWGIRNYV